MTLLALDHAAPVAIKSIASPTVRRFVWQPVQIGPAGGSAIRLRDRGVVVVGGSDDLADLVVGRLQNLGARARRHSPLDTDTDTDTDIVIDLNLADDFSTTDPGHWREQFLLTFDVLRRCTRHWATCTDADRLGYVAVTRMGGQMGFGETLIPQPLGGLWAGLAKGLPREFPTCNVKVIDIATDDPTTAADHIVAELGVWGLFEVGYANGHRWTLGAHEKAAPPTHVVLRPDDVVVMTGGGRGIGWALATHLARVHRCRVVVGGRAAAPDLTDPVISMSAADFEQLRNDRLRHAAASRTVAAVKRELDSIARTRDLAANLLAAQREGLDIVYCPHDVTDRASVDALLTSAGTNLVGVIHNAGVDKPARLQAKQPDTVREVLDVKVGGLLNLIEGLRDRAPLRFLSIVGSLTGRWGGMVGQLDYGAANEAVSRLGLWARTSLPSTPVSTLCWPTWDRLGMISNYEATLRYMSALEVGEGVRLWERELLAGTTGEVTFIGDVGPSIVPSLLRGYPAASGLPGIERLRAERELLGQPLVFAPAREIESRIDVRGIAACEDFLVDGQATLPVSIALEHCIAAARWTAPLDADELHLVSVDELIVDLRVLRAKTHTLVKTARGRSVGAEWHVDVALLCEGHAGLRATLVHRRTAPEQVEYAPSPDSSRTLARHPQLTWTGRTLAPARLSDGRIPADTPRDAFGSRHSQPSTLGLNAVETLVDIATATTGNLSFRVQRIDVHHPQLSAAGQVLCEPRHGNGHRWHVVDIHHRHLLTASGISATTSQEKPS